MKNPPSFALPKRTAYSAIRFILLTLQDLRAKSRKWYPSCTGTRHILPALHCQPCRQMTLCNTDCCATDLIVQTLINATFHLLSAFHWKRALIFKSFISCFDPAKQNIDTGHRWASFVVTMPFAMCQNLFCPSVKSRIFCFVLDTLIQFSIKAACAAVSHLTSGLGCWELF